MTYVETIVDEGKVLAEIATAEEDLWTRVKERSETSIKELEESLIFQKEVHALAQRKLQANKSA